MNDESSIREALAARSEAPTEAFRRSITSSLAQGRPRPTVQPWLAAVAVLLLIAVPVAILLATRTAVTTKPSPAASTASAARVQPLADATIPMIVALAADGTAWSAMKAPGGNSPLAVSVSRDGGTQWHAIVGLPSGQVPYLAAFDAGHAVFVWTETTTGKGSGAAMIFSTTDSGRTWRSYPLPAMPDMGYTFSFISSDEGWWLQASAASPSAGSVMHTTNGGRSWSRVGSDADGYRVLFVDSHLGFLGIRTNGALAPQVRRTTDGGATWKRVLLPPPPSQAGYPGFVSMTEVQRAERSTLVAILTVVNGSQGVGAPESLVAYTSTDSGATWSTGRIVWSGLTAKDGIPYFAAASARNWLIASGHEIRRTSDAGATWSSQTVAIPSAYQAVQLVFGNPSTGFLLEAPFGGCQGCWPALFKTTDGGNSWTQAFGSQANEPRATLGAGSYQGDPGTPVVLLKVAGDPRLIAASWDLSASGTTGASPGFTLPSPDGRYYVDGGQIYDRTGREVAALPWSAKGFHATWSTGEELCRAFGSSPTTGSPLTFQIAAIGKAPRTVARGFGTYSDNATYPVLACDEASNIAVVAELGQGVATVRAWVIQLSSGRVIRTFDYTSQVAAPEVDIRTSSDGALLSESVRSSSGSWTTTIRRTSDAGVVEVINNFDTHGFSGDSKLLAGVRDGAPIVIDRATQHQVWSAAGTGWGGVFAEPNGERFLIATAPDLSGQRYDLYVVAPNGAVSLLPQGTTADGLRY